MSLPSQASWEGGWKGLGVVRGNDTLKMTGIQCPKRFANGFLSSEHNELVKRKETNAVCRRAGIFFLLIAGRTSCVPNP